MTDSSREGTSDADHIRRRGMLAAALAVLAFGLLALACHDVFGRPPTWTNRRPLLTSSGWVWAGLLVFGISLTLAVGATVANRRSGRGDSPDFPWVVLTYSLAAAFVVVALGALLLSTQTTAQSGRPRRRRYCGTRGQGADDLYDCLLEMTASSRRTRRGDLTADERCILHDMWDRAAGHEAESIVSFLQLDADLASLGAPDNLRRRARAAADDEVHHTALASRLAADLSIDGQPSRPVAERMSYRAPRTAGTGPVRQYRLLRLAIESYVDGCANEGAEVLRLRFAAEHASPDLAIELTIVAADEAAHAELAWAVVEWAIAEGGPPVAWALAHRPLPGAGPRRAQSTVPPPTDVARLAAWGWVPSEKRRHCIQQAQVATRASLRELVASC